MPSILKLPEGFTGREKLFAKVSCRCFQCFNAAMLRSPLARELSTFPRRIFRIFFQYSKQQIFSASLENRSLRAVEGTQKKLQHLHRRLDKAYFGTEAKDENFFTPSHPLTRFHLSLKLYVFKTFAFVFLPFAQK
jgi:hypothetical protein